MSIFDSVVLGIVEGITEFLPISSTAHLAMTARVLGLAQTEFVKTFEIAIQLGAILAVVVVFWRKIISNYDLIKKVLVAFLPTAIIGFLLYKVIKNVLLENYNVIVWSLVIGGAIIVAFEWWARDHENQKTIDQISYYNALAIGIFQATSIIPGVSRSGATIIGGLFMGIERRAIVEFSFLLAIPTMIAATFYDVYKNIDTLAQSEINPLIVGFVVAFVSALFAIKFFISYIAKHNFSAFGFYRIAIGLIFLFVFL